MQHPLKKKRKSLPLWLLLSLAGLVLAGAVGFYAFSTREKEETVLSMEETEHPVKTVYEAGEDGLKEIRITSVKGESYTLRSKEGKLCLVKGEELSDINDAYELEIQDLFSNVTIQGTVMEDGTEAPLEDMGLSPARGRAEVDYANGDSLVLEMGITVPETGYCYLKISSESGIYMGDVGFSDLFSMSSNQLLPVEQPQWMSELVSQIRVSDDKGSFTLAVGEDGEGNPTYRLTEPWNYPADQEMAEALLACLDNFRLGSVAEAQEESQTEAGGRQVEIHQEQGLTLAEGEDGIFSVETVTGGAFLFTLGDIVQEHFLSCEYEGKTYLVNRYLISTLYTVTAEELVSSHPAQASAEDLCGAEITFEGQKRTLKVEREMRVQANNQIETDEDGEPIYDRTLTLDGREVSEEWLETLADALSDLTASGSLPDGWEKTGEPRWSILLTFWSGETRLVQGWRLDAFQDAVGVDGVVLFDGSNEEIERIVAVLGD